MGCTKDRSLSVNQSHDSRTSVHFWWLSFCIEDDVLCGWISRVESGEVNGRREAGAAAEPAPL